MQQRVELVVDLGLARRAHLVVAALQHEARVLQVGAHLVAQVDEVVVRSDGEVAALRAHLVAAVGAAVGLERLAGVPPARLRVDLVERAVHPRVEAHRVEDVELGLGAEVRRVGDAGAGQVVLRLAGHVARVARVRLAGERVVHEEVEVQRLRRAERVDACGLRIGQQHHVRLVDGLEAAHRRAVERQSVLEHALVERRSRDREVLDDTGQVAEPDVDVLDVLVLDLLDDVVGGLICHRELSLCLINPRDDARDTMLHGSQPYVAPTLRNSTRPMLGPWLPASVPGCPVRLPSSPDPRTRNLMIIQVSGWVYPKADPNLWRGWAGASPPCSSTG